jgi:hypothetical protein
MLPPANTSALRGHRLTSVFSGVVPCAMLYENFNRRDYFSHNKRGALYHETANGDLLPAIMQSHVFPKTVRAGRSGRREAVARLPSPRGEV